MRKSAVHWFSIVSAFIALFIIFQNVGCEKGGSKSSPPPPPAGSGEALYRIKAPDKTFIALERGKKRAEVPVPPEYKLYDLDVIENKGSKPAIMNELQKGHVFTLSPGAKVKIGVNSIVLFMGQTIFEFEKVHGEFRVVLPKGTLKIEGTRFEVNVESSGHASIRLYEGRVLIECNGKTSILENQATALIDDSSVPVKITPATESRPKENDLDSEVIQRNRKSTY